MTIRLEARMVRKPDGTFVIRNVVLDEWGEPAHVAAANLVPSGRTISELHDNLVRMIGACHLPVVALPLKGGEPKTLPGAEAGGHLAGQKG